MTVNGVITLILRYFTEFVYDVVVKQLPRFQNLLWIVCDHTNEYLYFAITAAKSHTKTKIQQTNIHNTSSNAKKRKKEKKAHN